MKVPSTEAVALDFQQAQHNWLEEASAKGKLDGDQEAAIRAPKACCKLATKAVEAARNNVGETSLSFRMQCLRIGPLALVGMEGEIFSEYHLALVRACPFLRVITVGFANGCIG